VAAKKYPNAKQLRRELDNNRLGACYLFLGEEEGEKDKCIQRILNLVFREGQDRTGSVGRFHLENGEFMQAADFIMSRSMFSSERVCIMMNIDSLKPSREIENLIGEVLESVSDDSRLIMTAAGVRPPRIFSGDQLESIKVVQFWRYFDNDMFNYVKTNVEKLGGAIDERAVELLIELTGKDIRKIDDAIEMIRYYGVPKLVTMEIVKNLIHDTRDVNVFEFIDSLFRRDRRSLNILRKMLNDGVPELQVLYMIQKQAETLETYYGNCDNGMSRADAMEACRIYSKNRDSFLNYTRNYPPARVKKIFCMTALADYQLKSGGRSRGLVSNPLFSLATDILVMQ